MTTIKELSILFKQGSKHRLLLSNISWQGLERGIRILAGSFTGILLASYLGPDSLGLYSYSMSFVLLFAPLISLGYDGLLVRDIIFQKDSWADILGSAAMLKFMGSVVAFFLIWAFIYYDSSLQGNTASLIRILSLSFLFYPFDVFDLWFRSKLKAKNASISKIIAIVLVNGLKLVFIYQKAPLYSFAWLYVAEFGVNGLLQLVFYQKMQPGSLKQWKPSSKRIKFVISESWPLLISSFSFMLYNKIDQIMIGNMMDNKSVGIFSAAGKISDLPLALLLVFNASLFPFMAENYKTDRLLYNKRYQLITALYTSLSYVLLLIVLFGSGFIMRIYPQSFAEGAIVLQINFVGIVFLFNSGWQNSYLSLSGNQKYLLYITVVSALLNILLNYILIPRYGIEGAAWASSITEFLSLFALTVVFTPLRYAFKVQAKGFLLFGLFAGKSD